MTVTTKAESLVECLSAVSSYVCYENMVLKNCDTMRPECTKAERKLGSSFCVFEEITHCNVLQCLVGMVITWISAVIGVHIFASLPSLLERIIHLYFGIPLLYFPVRDSSILVSYICTWLKIIV